jgi:chromosome segregation ATPase
MCFMHVRTLTPKNLQKKDTEKFKGVVVCTLTYVSAQLHLEEAGKELEDAAGKKQKLEEKLVVEKDKFCEMSKQIEGITSEYNREKEAYEAMSAEMEKTKAEFTVFERKDIKMKEDIKHLKAKDKKLKESIVKEQEKAEKAKESIPKQEKAISDAEATMAKMEKLIPSENQVLG